MFRVPGLALHALIVIAALPAVSRAQECMETSQIASIPVRELSIAEMSFELFGVPETSDPAVAEELRRMWDRAGYEHLTAKGDTVLWCYTPDDPRCNPVDGPASAPEIDSVHGKAAAAVPRVPLAPRIVTLSAFVTSAPRRGERSRVERPPEA